MAVVLAAGLSGGLPAGLTGGLPAGLPGGLLAGLPAAPAARQKTALLWHRAGALSRRRIAAALLGFAAALAMPGAGAAPGHAHVHGQAQLELGVDGGRLLLVLQIPMEALVGFERAPRNDDERARLARALELLRASNLFRPSPEAGCSAKPATLVWTSGGLADLPPDDTHTDLKLTLDFECKTPGRLAAVDVGAFDAFSRLRRIEARIAGPGGTSSQILLRGKRLLELRR